MIQWTKNQKSVIAQRRCDLLVSASAGAGKTTVMIERIASMIENKEAQISDLLVLTFTNASASDMKAKLQKRLGTYLDTAFIGTFHKFCGELVRTYFNIAELSPDFQILDETDAGIIRSEILAEVVTKNYDRLSAVIDTFCVNRKMDTLYGLLIEIYNFLATREDADAWLESCALASYDTDIAMQNILEHYNRAGQYYLSKFRGFGVNPFVEECTTLATEIMNVKNYDDLHRIALTANFTRLKRGNDEEFKAVREKFKMLVNKITDYFSMPYAAIQKNQLKDRALVVQIIELVKEFGAKYSQVKLSQNKLDFNDLEKYACTVLDNAEVAATVRQKYKYIFIDEYQDTNPMQERILVRVSRETPTPPQAVPPFVPKGNGNIFMVGDVKQSIYGFRGCEATIFAGKMTDFERTLEGKVIKLNENFRSELNILNFVNLVFGKIMKQVPADIDYNATSKFLYNCKHPERREGDMVNQNVEVSLVNTQNGTAAEKQAAVIAEKILHLVKNGVNLGDIAILSRSRNHFDELVSVLRRAGVPARIDSDIEAAELFEIALLNNMLFAVSNFYNDVPLVMLMSSFVFGFTPDELAEIVILTQGLCEPKAKQSHV